MARKTAKNDTTMKAPLVAVTTAAVASILANVAQAVARASTEKDADSLRADRDRIIRILGRVQKSYDSLNAKLASTRKRLERAIAERDERENDTNAWRKELDAGQKSYDRLAAESTAKDAELSRLRARLDKLEAQGGHHDKT
mgnify:FL=1